VIEDSWNGALEAEAAGMHIIATINFSIEREDLGQADIIVTCLGDPDGENMVLKAGGECLDCDFVLHAD